MFSARVRYIRALEPFVVWVRKAMLEVSVSRLAIASTKGVEIRVHIVVVVTRVETFAGPVDAGGPFRKGFFVNGVFTTLQVFPSLVFKAFPSLMFKYFPSLTPRPDRLAQALETTSAKRATTSRTGETPAGWVLGEEKATLEVAGGSGSRRTR